MYGITKEEKQDRKDLFVILESSPFCRVGYELDLCRSCTFYISIADYCERGLFEADEKEGRRRSVEDCLEYIDLTSIGIHGITHLESWVFFCL